MKQQKKIELSSAEMKALGTTRSWEDPTELHCPLGDTISCPEGYVVTGNPIEMWEGTQIGLKCKPAPRDGWSLFDESGTDSGSGTGGSGPSDTIKEVYCRGCSKQHTIRPADGLTTDSVKACSGYPIGALCVYDRFGNKTFGTCKLIVGLMRCQI